jgi:hypothetical protein
MNGPEILHLIRHDLHRAVARQGRPPAPRPIDASPWVAMSALSAEDVKTWRPSSKPRPPGTAWRNSYTLSLVPSIKPLVAIHEALVAQYEASILADHAPVMVVDQELKPPVSPFSKFDVSEQSKTTMET